MQIYQSGGRAFPKSSGLLEESLHVLRKIHNHEEDLAGESPASQWTDVSELMQLVPPLPLSGQPQPQLLVMRSVCVTTQPEKGNLGCCYSDSTV